LSAKKNFIYISGYQHNTHTLTHVVIASESDSSPDKMTQRKGKRVPPLPPLPVLPPPPPTPSTPSTSSNAVASKSLFGYGTGGYNSKPTVSGKSLM
jgi:hypothetical protein